MVKSESTIMGEKIPKGLYPVMKADLDLVPGLDSYIKEIQESRTYSNFGSQVTRLEQEYSVFFGVPQDQVVSASNATVALTGAMLVLNSDSWLVPSWTFVATAHAAQSSNKVFSFGDVNNDSWVLKPNGKSSRTGAVVTAPFGAKITIGKEWSEFDSILVDAAAAIAEAPIISKELDLPWAVVYSLHATKILGVGEGSIVVFSSPELASAFRSWSNFGFSGSRNSMIGGTNAKMSEIHGAIGRHRLVGWEIERQEWLKARNLVHKIGSELGINPMFSHEDWISPYWVVRFDSKEVKEEVRDSLRVAGFDTRDWWEAGCHTMPAFSGIPAFETLDNSDALAETTLGLPFGRKIDAQTVDDISKVIKRFL